ncbi:GAF domain-containing protein [Rhodococcus indonesiensis]|uniref:GAF domain-containing protein n=1 Tax=Rhodococcus indonesiensis TaxID=3055869 RepID=UPI0039F6640A
MATPQESAPDAWAAVFARMSGVLLSEQTVTTVLKLITSLAKDTLPGSAGAGVTLLGEGGSRRTSAATGPVVERLDALQYELGEGPCVTASHDGVVVRVDDLTEERRWPRWSPRAAREGMRATLSAPLLHADRCLGAIKVYSTRPHDYTAASEDILRRFAAQAAILLANMHTLAAAEQLGEKLTEALRTRDVIATAKGMLMLREHLDSEQAARRLLELSASRRVPVREVATAIVASAGTESV